MEEQTKESDVSLKEELEEKLKKISSLAPFCEKPPRDWIHAVGEVLGLNQIQLAHRLQKTQKELFHLEQNDLSGFIPKSLNRLGKALGGRFEYILIPNQRKLFEEKVDKNTSSSENFPLNKPKDLSSLPPKPPEGWINFIRESQGISSRKFAKKLQPLRLTQNKLNYKKLEAWERSSQVIHPDTRKLLSELRCRSRSLTFRVRS